MYDVPPPENDDEAFEMADKIRKWVASGRPKPGHEPKAEKIEEPEDEPEDEQDKLKEDKEEKPKKKGLFGWLKK